MGRLPCLGLAAAAAPGAVRAMELVEEEIRICLGLLGVTRYTELTPAHVHLGAPVVTSPHVFSAFPLLGQEGY
jgi:glycolate oxidase